ncbi:MAG TPA: serine hydrolase domain-containing protein [Chthoniobacterales bacterium]|nr:serine hydrolase domain-containing protein [Chthoniobacterales bacterium]
MLLLAAAILLAEGQFLPFSFTEPKPGYLETSKWIGEVPSQIKPGSQVPQVTTEVIKAMKASNMPGAAVVVMENDVVIYSAGFGYANLTTTEPFLATTASRCGSISKTATALATLKLADLGKLGRRGLDEKILPILMTEREVYALGGYDKRWGEIKVRDLLDHASGLPSNSIYLTSHKIAQELGKKMRLSMANFFPYLVKNQGLTASPGEKWQYTNLNYEILSLIIERKAGMRFKDAVRELVATPLGINPRQMFLSPTRPVPPDVKVSEDDSTSPEARCYQKDPGMFDSIFKEGDKVPEAYGGLDGDILAGAGHIAFSAEAIATMVQTLRTRPTAYLSKAMWDEILTPPVYVSKPGNEPKSAQYFYSKGTNVRRNPDGYTFDHGAMLMHAGGNYLEYKTNIQFVVIANSNMPNGQGLSDVILFQAVRKGLIAAGK